MNVHNHYVYIPILQLCKQGLMGSLEHGSPWPLHPIGTWMLLKREQLGCYPPRDL